MGKSENLGFYLINYAKNAIKLHELQHANSKPLATVRPKLFCRHFSELPRFFISYYFHIRIKLCASLYFDMISHMPRRVLKAWSCSIFRFLQQAFDSTLLKNHVNFKIKPKLLKMPQIKIKWIILWSKNTPDFLPNILLQYSHTKVGQFYCIFCIINKVKTRIFVFPHFLGHIRFFKL